MQCGGLKASSTSFYCIFNTDSYLFTYQISTLSFLFFSLINSESKVVVDFVAPWW